MKQSIRHRIRITKTGKLLRRPMGIGHSKTKQTSKKKQQKRKNLKIKSSDIKQIRKYI